MPSEPQDIYSATYALLLINRFLGTAPYVLISTPVRKYEIRLVQIVISFLKIGIVLLVLWFSVTRINENTITGMIRICSEVFFNALSVIFILCSVAKVKDVIGAFKMLVKIDRKFRSLGIWMSYRQIQKRIHIQLAFMILTTIILVASEIFLSEQFDYFDMTYLTSFIPQIMIVTVEIQYYNYLHLAMCRYRILNEYLDTLEKEKNIFSDNIRKTNLPQSINNRKLSAGVLKTANVLCNPYLILETVSDLHIQLTDMCTLFNKAFSIQLLFRVATSLIGIIFSIFYFIVDFQFQQKSNNDYTPFVSALMIFACVFCISELYILARISDKTCEEANNCPLRLHNIKHSCTDPEILDAIELYSIQMYHNKLQFTVCGLFPIDHTLLYSMTGAVTTYLIFLVQFSKSTVFIEIFKESYNVTDY